MPIAFSSLSHGRIAVGFFNIETDLLLMDRYFFFASDFCDWVIAWTGEDNCRADAQLVYSIQNPDMIGNLAGAIYGYEYSGFIGEVYKRFPFPKTQAGFKQKPDGSQNREIIKKIMRPFANQKRVKVIFSKTARTIGFGEYVFQQAQFQEIVSYVEDGGMPGWLDGKAPSYVQKMSAAVGGSKHWLFT